MMHFYTTYDNFQIFSLYLDASRFDENGMC